VKFRNDDVKGFTHGFFRDQVRDSLNEVAVKYTADELYGEKKSQFISEALGRVREHVSVFGVNVISLGYASSPRPPAQVVSAINTKIAAIQLATQKENELRQAEADAKKVVATAEGEAKKKIAMAEGEARASELVAKSITPQILQWRQMEIQQDAVRKWNGVLSQYNGSGVVPFLNIGK
jgi:regulator of protease activity HflC (stomatin/prohibitin superfamily)